MSYKQLSRGPKILIILLTALKLSLQKDSS